MRRPYGKLMLFLTVFLLAALAVSAAVAAEGTLELPPDVTDIEEQAFYGLTDVTRIVLPDSVQTIGDEAFGGSESLLEVEVSSAYLDENDAEAFAAEETRLLAGSPNAHIVVRSDVSKFQFRIDSDHAVLEKFLGETDTVCIIPGQYRGYTVTEIAASAFSSNRLLTKVVIPEGVTTIGNYAFYYCYYLTDVTFPTTLATVGKDAFKRCGYSVEGDWAFVLPDNITQMDDWDFPFDDIVIECKAGSTTMNTLISIGENFCLSDDHTLLYGDGYYYGTNSWGYLFLKRFTGDKTNLTSVTIPEGVVGVDNGVFSGCRNLTEIHLPGTIRQLSGKSFEYVGTNSESAFSVELPDDLAVIYTNGNSAFSSCDFGKMALVCSQGSTAARALSNYNQQFTTPGNLDFRFLYKDHTEPIEGEPYHKVSRLYLVDYYGAGGVVAIPEGVEVVGQAFSNSNHSNKNTTVTGVTFPDSLIAFDEYAFYHCEALESVAIPSGITAIPSSAFGYCSSLCEVTIPASVTSIGSGAFSNCATGIEGPVYYSLPDNLSGSSYKPFGDRSESHVIPMANKNSRTAKWLSGDMPDEMSGEHYWFTDSGETDFRYMYQKYSENNEQKYRLYLMKYVGEGETAVIPDGLEYIDGGAFTGNVTVTKVVIGEGVTQINDGAFNNCYNLTDITFPSTLKTLQQNVFNFCGENATEPFYFVLPDNMTDLTGRGGGMHTFGDCKAVLQTGKYSRTAELLTDRNYIYTVEDEHDFRYQYRNYKEGDTTQRRLFAVGYAGSDTAVSIPAGIYGVHYYAYYNRDKEPTFRNLTNVTSLVIPEGTAVIEESAFLGCTNLTSISFPDSLKKLKSHCFEQCGKASTELHYYVLPDNMTEVNNNTAAGWGAFTDINMGRIACAAESETALLVTEVKTNYYNGGYLFAIKGHETDGLLYRYEQRTENNETVYKLVLREYEGTSDEVTIPSGCCIYGIAANVFKGETNLRKISIPEGVVEIKSDAFNQTSLWHMSGTETVNDQECFVIDLPDTLATIEGNSTFNGVGSGYTAERFYLLLPSSLENFNPEAFYGCNAVFVAPSGSAAAGRLHNAFFIYYHTLEDAVAKHNAQYKVEYDAAGNVVEHTYYGKQ